MKKLRVVQIFTLIFNVYSLTSKFYSKELVPCPRPVNFPVQTLDQTLQGRRTVASAPSNKPMSKKRQAISSWRWAALLRVNAGVDRLEMFVFPMCGFRVKVIRVGWQRVSSWEVRVSARHGPAWRSQPLWRPTGPTGAEQSCPGNEVSLALGAGPVEFLSPLAASRHATLAALAARLFRTNFQVDHVSS